MADNGTEVISQGGEHGAVCMKTFNGQYNTELREWLILNCHSECCVFFAVANVMIQV